MDSLKLALLGFGNAGKAFVKMLEEKQEDIKAEYNTEVKVVAITTGSRGCLVNEEGINIEKALSDIENLGKFNKDSNDYADTNSIEVSEGVEYDVLIELTPLNIFTGQPAITHIKNALNRGKDAITANKGPIAWEFDNLVKLAKDKKSQFFYETTVMDGTPVFNLVDDTLKMCKIKEINGILNSTTNYVLEELETGKAYEEIIAEGKRRGFIEADETMDIDGWDAAAKTAALLNVLMKAGTNPKEIQREGISKVTLRDIKRAESKGKVIKLLCHGSIENGKVKGMVRPMEIERSDLLASINGTTSVVSITTDLMGTLSIVEHDPEIEQTAYGIFSDTIRILETKRKEQ